MFQRVILLICIAALFASCSMVKHSPSASFKKVKYNPHLKFAEHKSDTKLNDLHSKQESNELERLDSSLAEHSKTTYNFKEKNRSHLRKIKKVQRNGSDLAKLNPTKKATEKSQKIDAQPAISLVPIQSDRSINPSLEPLEPMTVSDDAVLDLIYIILIVLLILIVVGFLIDISGGLLGTLIAILLILLILHLLGII